jgi:hypothetical protein
MACINSAVRALIVSGQCGHSGNRSPKGHVLHFLLHSPGLGQTGERQNQTDVVFRAVCQYLVVTQDTNAICDAQTVEARHGEKKKSWFSGQI